jgi:hypothetical protein
MIVSIENLSAGIRMWRENIDWGSEFINDEYYSIYRSRESGIDEDWWKHTVERLWAWKAIRARRPPNSKKEIASIGLNFTKAIEKQYWKIRRHSSGEPSIEQLAWEDVAPLFALGLEIKCGSQVFACKMCHFLFPKLFLVMDNLATGVLDYGICWRTMKEEWSRFSAKEDACQALRAAIDSKMPLHPLYPFETKIMELSLIGYGCRSWVATDNKDGEPQIIVGLAGEGGEVTLYGVQVGSLWRFRMQVHDCPAELVDEEDAVALPNSGQTSPWVHTWPAAVALLDRYPWVRLLPQFVHPLFRAQVWNEVVRQVDRWDDAQTNLGFDAAEETLERWRKVCEREMEREADSSLRSE